MELTMLDTPEPSAPKDAEAEIDSLRRTLSPFVVAAETTRMPMIFTGPMAAGHTIIFANDAFLGLTGYDRDETLGQKLIALMTHGGDLKTAKEFEAALEGTADNEPEIYCQRKDGSSFCAAVFISPVHDEHGSVVQHFLSFVDLTRHKQEQALSQTLINELNHRVKNTLATVQSIVAQVLQNYPNTAVIRDSIESRLFSLTRSHDLLTRRNWEGVGLIDLVNSALEPFGVTGSNPGRFVITGKNIHLSPKITLALGIAINELATNAVKYGALSNDTGSILVTWSIQPAPTGDRLVLQWQEKDGPPIAAQSRKGFGSRVLERGLPHEIGGTVNLEYLPDGVICTIEIPAPPDTCDE